MRLLIILLAVSSWTSYSQTFTISTFAGGALPANTATSAVLSNGPQGVVVDPAGKILFLSQNSVFRLDPATGTLTLVAGNGTGGFNGDGPATSSQLNNPAGIAIRFRLSPAAGCP